MLPTQRRRQAQRAALSTMPDMSAPHVPSSAPTTAAASAPAPQDQWVTAPRGRLFARRWAATRPADGQTSRPPIVLFHDSLGCVELWRGFPAVLAAATGRDVIAYDRLGFGRSDARTDVLPLDFVEDEAHTALPALRAQLGIDRYVALGHSVGGGMAAHCAAASAANASVQQTGPGAHGDCEALVTIAAQACVEERTRQGIRDARDQFLAHPAQMERLARYHGGDARKAHWVLNAWVDTWLSPAFAAWSLEATLARVTCPVLALHGENDEYGSAEQPERIARWAAGPAQVELLPGLAHVPHREQPEAVAARVARFLTELPQAPGASPRSDL